ncbi:unnamed protein product [Closterium sp. NIES-65]|nr:unnamed protein product [Closterium sp. NIES-65]
MAGTHELRGAMEMTMKALGVQLEERMREFEKEAQWRIEADLKDKEMASKHHPSMVHLLGFCVNYDSSTGQIEQSDAVAMFKDPYLDAPGDLVLRWVRLALSCTAMPAAARPSMNQVLGELVKLKQEACGAHESHVGDVTSRVDIEIGSSIGSSSFTAEMARAEHGVMPSSSST